METLRGAFTLLSLLFLATSTVHAVNYKGPSNVDEGEPWSIECTNVQPKDEIIWTRNNESLEPEILKDDLSIVTKIRALKSSSISALEARPHHAGSYKCTNNSEEAFPLFVNSGNMFRVLSNESVPLTLKCGQTTSKDVVRWFKEKHDLLAANASEEFKKLQEFITVNTTTGTLVITKEADEVLGNYSCTLNGVSQEFKVVPKPTVVLPSSTTVIEGEKLHLVCNGKQTPGVKIMWTFGGKNYTKSSDRVKLSFDKDRGINGAVLTVENINMSDRGDIYCLASYDWTDSISKHHAEAKILLRVKDKLAALWPFLGICAEVVVLCAIILIYEKKRNKAELEESDTDQSPDTKPTPNKDSDVRQRK